MHPMKLNNRNLSTFLLLLFLGMLVGTLAWEVLERVLGAVGLAFSLQAGPVGFDAGVIAVSIRANPGTFLGIPLGLLVFGRV